MAHSREKRWEHFPHMADIGVRGMAPTLAEAFEQAALAMCAVVADPSLVHPEIAFDVDCQAAEMDLLLVDWLNALASEMSAHRMIFSRFHVEIQDGHLRGKAWGEPAIPARHQPAVEVKGATLTELRVSQDSKGQWIAQCVVDV